MNDVVSRSVAPRRTNTLLIAIFGGMALVLTHSDYVENRDLLDAYRQLLAEFADDTTAWKALPRDVSNWWRRRAGSHLEEVDGEWTVVGPAKREARVEFSSPQAVTA